MAELNDRMRREPCCTPSSTCGNCQRCSPLPEACTVCQYVACRCPSDDFEGHLLHLHDRVHFTWGPHPRPNATVIGLCGRVAKVRVDGGDVDVVSTFHLVRLNASQGEYDDEIDREVAS